MAILYKPGTIMGEAYPPPANGKHYTLDELQTAIGGGYIEMVQTPFSEEHVMIVDEEGKLKQMDPNVMGCLLHNNPHDYIAGLVLLVPYAQLQSEEDDKD